MEKAQRQEISEYFEPLINDLGPVLKSVVLYGSSVRKERVEGSDIDLMIILDDTHEDFSEMSYFEAKQEIQNIQEQADEDLHIQPPKMLSNWWKLLLQGEPWAITSLRYSQPVYDPSGYTSTMKVLLNQTKPVEKDERAKKLIDRAKDNIQDGRANIEDDIVHHIVEGMTAASKEALRFQNTPPLSKETIPQELEDRFLDEYDIFTEKLVEFYQRMIELEEELAAGETAIDAVSIDKYSNRALKFIGAIGQIFRKEAEKQQEDIRAEAYQKLIELCNMAIAEEYSGLEAIEQFKKEYIETNRLSDEYRRLINDIEGKQDQENYDLENIYTPLIELKDFETALKNVIDQEKMNGVSEYDTYSEKSQLEPLEEFKGKILADWDQEIKSIWILTIEDLLETEDVTLVILVDDLGRETEGLKEAADSLEEDIKEDYGFKIHTTISNLSNYWKTLQSGSQETLSEIKTAIPLYDPEGFFRPIDKLIEDRDLSTIKSMSENIIESPKKILKPREDAKISALENYYSAAVEIGQASLLTIGISPPVQKKVPKSMRQHLIDETHLFNDEEVALIEQVIRYWKDYEHGQLSSISPAKLDEFARSLEELHDKAEKLAEESAKFGGNPF